jgi:SAM-dependent methyltransferase
MTSHDPDAPHSSAYFGGQRDHWWNKDYLELLARRWQLDTVRTVLDVGCGIGHWGMLLASVLPAQSQVVGVERDGRSVRRARERARERDLPGQFDYRVGVAEDLPFDDATFDLVTCQTLLIHVPDVGQVISEMRRVVKPGGLLIVAEPNNVASLMVATSRDLGESLAARVERMQFVLTCERGKVVLGEGDNSVGDLVPGIPGASRSDRCRDLRQRQGICSRAALRLRRPARAAHRITRRLRETQMGLVTG